MLVLPARGGLHADGNKMSLPETISQRPPMGIIIKWPLREVLQAAIFISYVKLLIIQLSK